MPNKTPTFKPYNQHQIMMLPPSLEELVPLNHAVRVVNEVINRINVEPLLSAYQTKGTSSYHPLMLLKVLVYGYVSNIYSSRKLEAACKENIHFMWLSAMNRPDHHTINRFRGERLKEALRKVFEQVVILLAEEGLLSIEEVYTDGTKIEANANKYTFVWKKAGLTNKEKMKVQINQIWQYAQSISDTEDDLPEPPDLTTIDKEKVEIAIAKLNEALADKENIDKKVKAKLNYINKNFIKNIQKYEQQEAGTSTDSNSKLMLLNSEQGIAHRKKRCHDVEPVFGNIKHNHGFRRFMLRGKKKVEIEWGLISIAHNIRKKAA